MAQVNLLEPHRRTRTVRLLDRMFYTGRPRSRIRSVGACLPDRIVDNAEVAALVNCPDAHLKESLPRFIEGMTGIRTRRWADRSEPPSVLACKAARMAIRAAGMCLRDIDTLIFAATDGDQLEPSTASIVQERLGLRAVNSFNVKSACNSVLQAMFVLDSLIAGGACRNGLIVSGETGSHWISKDIRDRADLKAKLAGLTLGDGGAAVLMERSDDERGLLEFNLTTLADHWKLCRVPNDLEWRTRPNASVMGWFYLDLMALAEVVQKYVPAYYGEYATYRESVFDEACFTDHLHYLIPHQISERLIRLMCNETGMPLERTAITAQKYGNTGAMFIPIAFDEAIQQNRISLGSGEEVFLFGAASGFSIGHVRVRL